MGSRIFSEFCPKLAQSDYPIRGEISRAFRDCDACVILMLHGGEDTLLSR